MFHARCLTLQVAARSLLYTAPSRKGSERGARIAHQHVRRLWALQPGTHHGLSELRGAGGEGSHWVDGQGQPPQAAEPLQPVPQQLRSVAAAGGGGGAAVLGHQD